MIQNAAIRKILLNLLMTAAVLLAACSQATPAVPPAAVGTSVPNSPATAANLTTTVAQAADTPASSAAAAQPPTQPAATGEAGATNMTCQVVSTSPTQGPTEISMFPPADKDDWVLGKNASAALTIIEYSDFQ